MLWKIDVSLQYVSLNVLHLTLGDVIHLIGLGGNFILLSQNLEYIQKCKNTTIKTRLYLYETLWFGVFPAIALSGFTERVVFLR